MYHILPYSYRMAKKIGVQIRPSTSPGKKVDVYKNEAKIASVGATGYSDYPHYLQSDPQHADEHRADYKRRHHADRTKRGTPGWYADKLLW